MSGVKPDDAFLNRYLYFHVPHYRQEVPHSAIVSGDKKVMHFYASPDIPMLFDLSDDPGEVRNIARQHPQVHKRLYAEMMRYFKQVGARIPKRNPNYDPAEYQKHKDYPEHVMWGPFEGDRPLDLERSAPGRERGAESQHHLIKPDSFPSLSQTLTGSKNQFSLLAPWKFLILSEPSSPRKDLKSGA